MKKFLFTLAGLFQGGMPDYTNWLKGAGTKTKRDRTPGKRNPAGNKLARMAREHRLDYTQR